MRCFMVRRLIAASCVFLGCVGTERDAQAVVSGVASRDWEKLGPEQPVCPTARVTVFNGAVPYAASPALNCRIASVAWAAVVSSPDLLASARVDSTGLPVRASVMFMRWTAKAANGRDSTVAYWNVGFGTKSLSSGVLSVFVDSISGEATANRKYESDSWWRSLQ
jgi:hypothetical protein